MRFPSPAMLNLLMCLFSMIHVLAFGVICSGYLKDLLCLPRPLSPPLQRITMSGYAALEYGFPSTHSTNAVSVAVYSVYALRTSPQLAQSNIGHLLTLLLYFNTISIILGRLYCGMHGFFDVIIGGLLGALIAIIQCAYGGTLDAYLYAGSYKIPLLVFVFVCALVRLHPEPADDCPCFDDSVSFGGVVVGVEFGHWHYARTGWALSSPVHATVPFSLHELGWIKTLARIILGVLTIIVWREIAKPTLLRSLPPLFRLVERLGLNLPRRFFMQASYVSKNPLAESTS